MKVSSTRSPHPKHSRSGAMLVKTASSSALLVSPRNTRSSMNMFAWDACPSSPMCASLKDKYLQSCRRRRASLQKAQAMLGGSHANSVSDGTTRFHSLVFRSLSPICNRLLCNEDSLKELVHMGSTLNSVINKHGHAFPQSQLDMLLIQSMNSLALELIHIHRIHHSGIRKQRSGRVPQ